MSITFVADNKPAKWVYRPVKPPWVVEWSLHNMAQIVDFCTYPDDLDGCQQAIIEAYRLDNLLKHCIIEGLKLSLKQCRQVLSNGLYNKDSAGQVSTGANSKELKRACEQIIIFGYPLKIRAIHEIFYEAFHKLVNYNICKLGITDENKADDIFQEIFVNLHEYFLKGISNIDSLTGYIAQTTRNACIALWKREKRQTRLPDDYKKMPETGSSEAIIPAAIAEYWEMADNRLLNTKQGNLINRIILAQLCVEGRTTNSKLSAKTFIPSWRKLSDISDEDIANLHEKATTEAKHFAESDTVLLAAKLINSCFVAPDQVAMAFAAATGMDTSQIRALLNELSSTTDNAIHTRISRIRTALRPIQFEDGKDDDMGDEYE